MRRVWHTRRALDKPLNKLTMPSAPTPDKPGDYRLDATHPQFPLTNEAEVRAWIQSMFHAGTWDALMYIRFV
jgi:hypothetical protein